MNQMDNATKSALTGLFLLFALIGIMMFLPSPGSPPSVTPPLPTTAPPVSPPVTETAPSTSPLIPVYARIDIVDTSKLALGRVSYAYVTITNTGTVPITKTRIEITAGRDFGFPIGYQSRSSIQELYDRIGPGETHILTNSFNLPRYEGIISLEGLYQVTVRVYTNDWYYIGEWRGEVYLRG